MNDKILSNTNESISNFEFAANNIHNSKNNFNNINSNSIKFNLTTRILKKIQLTKLYKDLFANLYAEGDYNLFIKNLIDYKYTQKELERIDHDIDNIEDKPNLLPELSVDNNCLNNNNNLTDNSCNYKNNSNFNENKYKKINNTKSCDVLGSSSLVKISDNLKTDKSHSRIKNNYTKISSEDTNNSFSFENNLRNYSSDNKCNIVKKDFIRYINPKISSL